MAKLAQIFPRKLRNLYRLLFHYPAMARFDVDSDDYWEKRNSRSFGKLNSFQQFRAEWICSNIDDNATVFDIGSGDGMIPEYIRVTKNALVTPSDNSIACIEFLGKIGFDPVMLDLNDNDFQEKIPSNDHIIICEVLEHLANTETVLSAAIDKAKISVIFSVPNTGFYPYRLRLFMGKFPMQWRAHPGEHLRFWTLRDMKWWLRELGLYEQATIKCYEGTPVLRNLWPSLFSAAMIVKIETD